MNEPGASENGDENFKKFLQSSSPETVDEFVVDASIGQLDAIRKMMAVVLDGLVKTATLDVKVRSYLETLIQELGKASVQAIRMIDYVLIKETDDGSDEEPQK